MIRFLIFLLVLAGFTFGLTWVMDRPGAISLTWQGYHIETSILIGIVAVLVLAIVIGLVWTLFRFIFRIPSLLSFASQVRRRNKGLSALSRGMIAAGAGDARTAQRSADEALRHLPSEPLALLLQAQAAQLGGNREAASQAFTKMLDKPETRLLGLRGLHIEAKRRGDDIVAHDLAREAHLLAPVPWAGQAVLEHKTARGDWQGALATVDANIAARSLDRRTATRQRAVLQTAIAQEKTTSDPDTALQLARDALKAAPDLVPAAVVAGRLLARRGDLRKASRVVEAAWVRQPHPELAQVYLDMRPGDSTADRLARAKVLSRLKPDDIESRLTLARAALDTRDFTLARATLRPLIEGEARPTARTCLLMAQLEETEQGATGPVREWLARASRAPRDKAWVCEGAVSDTWAPVSPVNGQIDAFHWRTPNEQLSAHGVDWEPAPIPPPAAPETAIMAPPPEETLQLISAPAPPAPAFASLVPTNKAMGEIAVPPRKISTPVIFPRPNAPDDPGMNEPESKPSFGFLNRD